MAAKQTKAEKDEEQRLKINSMEQTQREVIIPSLNDLKAGFRGFAEKDFITRGEADTKFMTKSDFRPYAVALGTIATVAIGVIVGAVLKGVFK